MTSHKAATPLRRARHSFWFLFVVSVVAAGSLSSAISAEPSPGTGLRLVTSGLILITSVLLAARVRLAIDRATRKPRNKPSKARS